MADHVTRGQFKAVVAQAFDQGVRLDEIITAVTDVALVRFCLETSAMLDVEPPIDLAGFEPGGGSFGGGGASGNW